MAWDDIKNAVNRTSIKFIQSISKSSKTVDEEFDTLYKLSKKTVEGFDELYKSTRRYSCVTRELAAILRVCVDGIAYSDFLSDNEAKKYNEVCARIDSFLADEFKSGISFIEGEFTNFVGLRAGVKGIAKLRKRRRLDYDYSRRKVHIGELQDMSSIPNLSKQEAKILQRRASYNTINEKSKMMISDLLNSAPIYAMYPLSMFINSNVKYCDSINTFLDYLFDEIPSHVNPSERMEAVLKTMAAICSSIRIK